MIFKTQSTNYSVPAFIDHHANILQEQMDRGGMLLWVHTSDAGDESRALEILAKHSSDDVHVHRLPEGIRAILGAPIHDDYPFQSLFRSDAETHIIEENRDDWST